MNLSNLISKSNYTPNKNLAATLLILLFLMLLNTGCAANSPTPTQLPPSPTTVELSPSPTSILPSPTTVLLLPSPTSIPLLPTTVAVSTTIATALPTVETVETACVNIEHVVIISVDGLRPDAIEQTDTPVIDALRKKGAYTDEAKTVLPSVTLVSHASMLGGMTPAKHGVNWNSNDPSHGKIKGETIFSLAHQSTLSTAMIVGKPKLKHLVLPNSVDNYIYAGFTDGQVASQAVETIQAGLPNILFIHMPNIDSTGHAAGWMSRIQLMALSHTDSLIGGIVKAVEEGGYMDKTLLIITSDHGGSDSSHGSDSPEDMLIPWLAVGAGVSNGITLQSKVVTYDTAATVMYALNIPIPEMWDGTPVLEIFNSASCKN